MNTAYNAGLLNSASIVTTTTAHLRLVLLSCLLAMAIPLQSAADKDSEQERERIIRAIQSSVLETSSYIDRKELDTSVMDAMGRVPRHEFVPGSLQDHAYENRPLPIGHGQTISQPYIVALMTDLLNIGENDQVLEIGTGSGYQAAILAELVRTVYSIEIIEALGEEARERLKRLGYRNVEIHLGDGYYGWEEHAPFDAIVVTAAASYIPPPLIRQLRPGGRMIIPVGSRFMTQQLVLVEKDTEGKLTTRQILPVRFVPLTGGHD